MENDEKVNLNISDENDISDKNIKIYSSDDKKMRELGNILSTPKSRQIYQILIEKQLNAKEIGKLIDNDENPRLPNLIYHLDNMVKVGLLTVEKRSQRKHGHILKYYKAISIILIVPKIKYEKAVTSKTLFTTLKAVFKLSIIIGFGSFFLVKFSSLIQETINPNNVNVFLNYSLNAVTISCLHISHTLFFQLERFFLNDKRRSVFIEC